MTSKERIFAVLEGKCPDHIPLTTWCFGLHVPKEYRWDKEGIEKLIEIWKHFR